MDESSVDVINNHGGISAVDYRLIGLSPQYWSYTPMLIGDLIGLPLINGVDCFISPRLDNGSESGGSEFFQDSAAISSLSDDSREKTSASSSFLASYDINEQKHRNGQISGSTWNIIPVSRVLLRGTATVIDRRPNGNTLIVVDDGTGCIDCLYREDFFGGKNAYITAFFAEHEQLENSGDANHRKNFYFGQRFTIGDSLEVMGEIKTLTAGNVADGTLCEGLETCNDSLEVRFGCIREVHVTSVCNADFGTSRTTKHRNGDMVHWLKCTEFSREMANNIRNGKDVLTLLGNQISKSILNNSDFCAYTYLKANTILNRKCCQTPRRFRKALFYCHCEGTLETMDPKFQFRDALLHHLLDMEKRLKSPEDSPYRSVTEDAMDLFGAKLESCLPPLIFKFESILRDEDLSSLSLNLVSQTSNPDANALRLLRKTIAAVTKDGILSLYDHEKDLYLLVSRTRVIEPYLRLSRGMKRQGGGIQIPAPFFVRGVPKKRMNEVWNWIESGGI
mmetsp:Transcript_17819/g.37203  ORF Transcript_17819/g.37203 Transcript_17819/m.37203 type:complete len:506 (-) Transcript_17819:33-1550(-)